MADRNKVLITDDEKFVQSMLSRFLREDYDIRSAYDGLECLGAAKDWNPDIILLDVEMPGENGYEVCYKLKQNEQTKEIPVVFLSSKSSLRERMLGYEAGAEDYLIKWATPDELKTKLKKISSYTKSRKKWINNIDNANQAAMEAMSTSYELGQAIKFIESSIPAWNHDMLGECLMGFVKDLNLSAVAVFNTEDGDLFFSSCNLNVSPLERQLVEMIHEQERFKDFGCRTQINFPNVSLLIKNMPVDDANRYGRLKDMMPFVLSATDLKVRMIDGESAFMQHSSELSASIEKVKDILMVVQNNVSCNINGVTAIMDDFTSSMSIELMSMGLEQDQEEYVLYKVEEISKKLHERLLDNDNIDMDLKQIITTLEHLTEDQNKMIKGIFYHGENDSESSKNDAELF